MADVSSPIAVLTDGIFTQVTAGLESGYGLRADGAVFSWGDNTYGQLGDGTYQQRNAPVSVVGGNKFNYIAAGWHHILGIETDGTTWSWGDNETGQLGISEQTSREFDPSQWENVGTQALFLPSENPVSLNITVPPTQNGATYIPALGSDGTILAGHGVDFDISVDFQLMQHPSTSFWIAIMGVEEYNTEVEFNCQRIYNDTGGSSDGYRGVYIKQNGGVVNFGNKTVHDDIFGKMRLTRVGSLWTFYAWWLNDWHVIQTMTSLEGPNAVKVRLEMRTGDNFPTAEVNFSNFSPTIESTEISTQPIQGNHEFVKVDAGECHSMGLKADGTVWTWGCNEEGQLGYETLVGAIAGYSHGGGGAAIDQNGVLWSWGYNIAGAAGILGDGTIISKSLPVSVLNTGGKKWMNVTPGPSWQEDPVNWEGHPCNIPGNCRGTGLWGDNQAWAIKDEFTGFEDVVEDHPDFYTSLWMWGAATAGNHGNGQWNVAHSSPVSVLGSGQRGFWTAATGSGNTSCALDHRGQLWCWGNTGQLNAGPLGFPPYNSNPLNSWNSPVEIAPIIKEENPGGYLPGGSFDPFYANAYKLLRMGSGGSGVLLDGGGRAFVWGSNKCKLCRGGSPYFSCSEGRYPQLISSGIWPGAWKDADMGEDHSIWLTNQGNVYMCGYNDVIHGMSPAGCAPNCWFGGGGPTNRSTPTLVQGSPHQAIKVASGISSPTHGFLREDGSLWMWGENNNGECGVGDTVNRSVPTSVIGSGTSYKFIDFNPGGESGTVALDEDGQVYGWGSCNDIGAGVGCTGGFSTEPLKTSLPLITPEAFRSSPTRIGNTSTGPFFTDIAAGNQHNVALQADGSAWAWGSNSSGQLGDGTTLDAGAPVSVKGGVDLAYTITPEEDGLIEVIDIAAGTDYSMALGNPMTSNCPIFFDPLIADINNELNPTHWTEVPKIDSTITVGRRMTAKPALKLEDASSIAGNQYVLSNFTLDGEFIIETEWAYIANGGVIWAGSLMVQSNDPDDDSFAYIGKGNFPASSYRFRYFADGGINGTKDVVSGVDEGKLRLTRTIAPTGTGMDLKAEHYYPATDTWTQVGIKQPWYPGVVDVRLDMFKSAVATTTEFWFANLCIKEGTFSGDTGNLLWSWGDDQCGKLGDDLSTNKSLPIVAFTIRK